MKQYFITAVNNRKILMMALTGSMLFSACRHDHDGEGQQHYDVVYLQSNNFNANQNTVLAYIDKGSGKPEPMTGSP